MIALTVELANQLIHIKQLQTPRVGPVIKASALEICSLLGL